MGRALIVGGGTIALRKARTLVEGGLTALVIAPEFAAAFASLEGLECESRPFAIDDLARERWSLVFACTSDRALNRAIGEAAREAGLLVLVADAQDESSFSTPATLRDGALAVALSTGGAAPAVTKALREQVLGALGEGWAERIVQAAQERRASRQS